MIALILFLSLQANALTLDFVSHEWGHILREECNTLSKDRSSCLKACTILKENSEVNCLGLTIRANPDFYFNLVNKNINSKINWLSQVCTEPTITLIKKRYYNKYFKPFERLDKCVRLAVFDIGVLSGVHRAKKYLKRANKSGLKGRQLRDHIIYLYVETYLKKIKFKSGKHKGKLMFKFYRGWFNRIDRGKKLSEKFCR